MSKPSLYHRSNPLDHWFSCYCRFKRSFRASRAPRMPHCKKRFTSFPSPAGMSLTKLPLGRNNSVMTSLFPPRESLVLTSRLGTGKSRTFFYGAWLVEAMVAILNFPEPSKTSYLFSNLSKLVWHLACVSELTFSFLLLLSSSYYTLKQRFASFPSPAGMSLPNSHWAGIMTS